MPRPTKLNCCVWRSSFLLNLAGTVFNCWSCGPAALCGVRFRAELFWRQQPPAATQVPAAEAAQVAQAYPPLAPAYDQVVQAFDSVIWWVWLGSNDHANIMSPLPPTPDTPSDHGRSSGHLNDARTNLARFISAYRHRPPATVVASGSPPSKPNSFACIVMYKLLSAFMRFCLYLRSFFYGAA